MPRVYGPQPHQRSKHAANKPFNYQSQPGGGKACTGCEGRVSYPVIFLCANKVISFIGRNSKLKNKQIANSTHEFLTFLTHYFLHSDTKVERITKQETMR